MRLRFSNTMSKDSMGKDAMGFRPRDWDSKTTEQIEADGLYYAGLVKQQLEDEIEDNDPDAWKKYV